MLQLALDFMMTLLKLKLFAQAQKFIIVLFSWKITILTCNMAGLVVVVVDFY